MQGPYVAEYADKRNENGKMKPGSHISKDYKKKVPISNRSKTGRRKAPPQLSFTKGVVTTLSILHGHLCLDFPLPGVWVGYLTTEVPLD